MTQVVMTTFHKDDIFSIELAVVAEQNLGTFEVDVGKEDYEKDLKVYETSKAKFEAMKKNMNSKVAFKLK